MHHASVAKFSKSANLMHPCVTEEAVASIFSEKTAFADFNPFLYPVVSFCLMFKVLSASVFSAFVAHFDAEPCLSCRQRETDIQKCDYTAVEFGSNI